MLYGPVAGLVDLIWPPRSLLSDKVVAAPGLIEAEHWATLTFLSPPWCAICGFPFELAVGPGMVCGACAAQTPDFGRARAALAYTDASRPLLLQLKHGGRRDGLDTFAAFMAQAGAEVLADADLLLPVPLHWRRLFLRRFNQAAWLAAALSKRSAVPWHPGLLRRVKARRSQGGLSASARQRNVQGVFRASPKLAGKKVVVIDDVMTTGATLEACARACKAAGVVSVDVLALARVVRPSDPTI